MLVVLTFGAYLPSTWQPAYQQDFGIDDLTMTLVYATFAVVSAPALVLFGQATDAIGARPVLRGAVVAAAAGSASFVFATGAEWLFAGRAAQGLALGAATAAASSLTASYTGRRVHPAALAGIAFVGGTAAGPVVGGLLARVAPESTALPFAAHLGLLAIGWRLVSSLEPAAIRAAWRPAVPRIPHGMRRLFTSAAATGFVAWMAAGLFLAIIPLSLERSGQPDPAVTGAILGLVLVCSIAAQPSVRRLGPRLAQPAGLGALVVGLVLVAASGGGSATVTLVAAVIAGAGHGLAYGGASAAVETAAPTSSKAAITGALHVAFYLGSAIPAVLVGLITLVGPLPTATTIVATLAAVGAVAAAGSGRWAAADHRDVAGQLEGARAVGHDDRVAAAHGDGSGLGGQRARTVHDDQHRERRGQRQRGRGRSRSARKKPSAGGASSSVAGAESSARYGSPVCRTIVASRSASHPDLSSTCRAVSKPTPRCPFSGEPRKSRHSMVSEKSVGCCSSTTNTPAPMAWGRPAGMTTVSPADTGTAFSAPSIDGAS
ncbi:hypothetical protein BJF85_24545 [Saccharomonospora sp. CUA-673]|nr:hypothetical protein BJF85_24545 [Saccharomonospora sp. CUA-673]